MPHSQETTRIIAILLFDGFSNLCLANAVEPLRAANTLSGHVLYRWQFVSLSDAIVHSSSDLPVQPTRLADFGPDFGRGDYLFVMPSYGHRAHATPQCARALRAAAPRFEALVGLDTGSWLLAAAGLLDGRRATSHWDILTSLAETFPEVTVTEDRYLIDGDRLSCGGATTTLELMLDLIARHHGADLALQIGAMFMYGERASGQRAERHDRDVPAGRLSAPPLVRAAASLMRRHVEVPLSMAAIAKELNISQRGLEAAFHASTGQPPSMLYRKIRLAEARRWIEHSAISIAEVATRCGYKDASAMTRAFGRAYGVTPRALRK